MKDIDWIAIGKLGVVLIAAALALWRFPAGNNLLVVAGLLLYAYLSMRWCCQG